MRYTSLAFRTLSLLDLVSSSGMRVNITRTEALTPPDTSTLDKPERVPFVITYNPALRSISSIIRKHFHILISSPRCYNVFKAAPIVVYRRSSNLSDFLVRAQLRNLAQHNQPRGSYPCEKNCLTCKYISDGQTSYTFHSTGETRPITNHIDCNSKNVISMIQCNQCYKQYIGETKRRLKDRFNEHRRPVDNPSNISKPTTVSGHFLTYDHSANDITLIPLELTKSNRDSVRKAREAYLIERGKTLEPLGILIRKMKCNTIFISSLCYHLFFYFSISNFFQSLLQRFLFSTFTCYHSIYCTLFLIFKL